MSSPLWGSNKRLPSRCLPEQECLCWTKVVFWSCTDAADATKILLMSHLTKQKIRTGKTQSATCYKYLPFSMTFVLNIWIRPWKQAVRDRLRSVMSAQVTSTTSVKRARTHICVCKLLIFSDGVRDSEPAWLRPHVRSDETTTQRTKIMRL